jgi:uncharacterized protein
MIPKEGAGMKLASLLIVAFLSGSPVALDGEQTSTLNPVEAASAKALGEQLREKADKGDATAQNLLGGLLEIAGRYQEAAVLYRRAADQGQVSAQGSLGNLYRTGSGVRQDFSEAFKWSKAAADEGDPLGQFSLAGIYYLGQGRPVDEREGANWARKAAEQDCATRFRIEEACAQARFLLASSYADGKGVPQDYVLAHMWANLAAASLSAEARDAAVGVRDRVAARMTQEQVGEAQRLARDWKPR